MRTALWEYDGYPELSMCDRLRLTRRAQLRAFLRSVRLHCHDEASARFLMTMNAGTLDAIALIRQLMNPDALYQDGIEILTIRPWEREWGEFILFNDRYTDETFILDRYLGVRKGSRADLDRISEHISPVSLESSSGKQEIKLIRARTRGELEGALEALRQGHWAEGVSFRGQRKFYPTPRTIVNPYYFVPGLGEPSLLPSSYRKYGALAQERDFPFKPFLFEVDWIEELRRRLNDKLAEDLSDPAVRRYSHKDQLVDADAEIEEYVEAGLNDQADCIDANAEANAKEIVHCVYQQYASNSRVLDLTASAPVAVYFSAAAVRTREQLVEYMWEPSEDLATLFVFRSDFLDMTKALDGSLHYPERIERQAGRALYCQPSAPNAAIKYLVAVIQYDQDLARELLDLDATGGRLRSKLFDGREDWRAFAKRRRAHSGRALDVMRVHQDFIFPSPDLDEFFEQLLVQKMSSPLDMKEVYEFSRDDAVFYGPLFGDLFSGGEDLLNEADMKVSFRTAYLTLKGLAGIYGGASPDGWNLVESDLHLSPAQADWFVGQLKIELQALRSRIDAVR